MWNWKNMMKRFSTRADKWLYVFALISHIFNFLAKSQILFLYHIDDHQDHLFQSSNHSSDQLLFFFFSSSSSSSFFFFSFSRSVFLLSFNSSLLFLSFSVVDRVNLVFRRLSWFVRFSENQKNPFLSLFLILLLFFLLFFQNVPRY